MSLRRREPRLADCVGGILPARDVTLFLKACLDVGTAENWHLWSRRPDLKTALSGSRPKVKRLLPLLAHALEREGIEVDEPTRAVLRLACLWEERRTVQVRAIRNRPMACLPHAKSRAACSAP